MSQPQHISEFITDAADELIARGQVRETTERNPPRTWYRADEPKFDQHIEAAKLRVIQESVTPPEPIVLRVITKGCEVSNRPFGLKLKNNCKHRTRGGARTYYEPNDGCRVYRVSGNRQRN